MIFEKRSIHFGRNQSGFTLIELLVALAVGSLILVAAGATLAQLWSGNTRNTAHMLAVKQVENAVHFLVRDVQMAQTVQTTGLDAGQVLKLNWVDWAGTTYQVVYNWNAADHTLGRTYSADNVVTVVAYSVNQQPAFSQAGQVLTVNLTCTVNGVSETRKVDVVPRPGT